MILHPLDWFIAVGIVLLCFLPALAFGKRSGKSTSEFFAGGAIGSLVAGGESPWLPRRFRATRQTWSRTLCARKASRGNWQWWAFTLTGVATVFFYARLWRRSGVPDGSRVL